ncbi:O-antigen flippase Wzx [Flavobacterium frigoris PS1]|uniref:O-antigen flippase Wzx n=2 Tax=Flavobacterium frigoris TaxID=229204 RepID=H7FMM8_FLAFP|nr:O-antigen flippase Wzx [Flavobacterium frigoris PS1]
MFSMIDFNKLLKLDAGNKRSVQAKKNILASVFIRGANIVIGLLMVSLTINYLDTVKYGIWVTLSSLIAWFSFFDIGFGNGLRNKFAEALAQNNVALARKFVSTTYFILSIIIIVLIGIFIPLSNYIDWNLILNVSQTIVSSYELKLLAIIIFSFFGLNFVFKLITTILIADQRPALAAFLTLLGNILSLAFVFFLLKSTVSSLLYLGFVISIAPVIILIISTFIFFSGTYKEYRPSYKSIDLKVIPSLFGLGIKFFIIQIAAILLYQTNNIIISQLYGPKEVTSFNIAFKYFSVLMMLFSIVISPFWSAFTEASVNNDNRWIRNIMKKLFKFWGVLVLVGLIMLFISSWIYPLWVGENVVISFWMSILVLIWTLINTWNSIFSTFLNGIGKIKLQLFIGIFSALLNIPLAIFLGKEIGLNGIFIANIIVSLLGAFIYPIQYKKLIFNGAKGIWNA